MDMTRFGTVFGILLAAAGCGRMGDMMGARAPFGSRDGRQAGAVDLAGADNVVVPTAPGRADNVVVPTAPGRADNVVVPTAPDCVRIPEASVGFSRMSRGRGYFWIGYTAVDVGVQDLSGFGGGDGFTFGTGFRLSESSRTYIELILEKSLKHEMDPSITPDAKGYHERTLFGLRTATAPRARMQNQPRPYVSYGVGYNTANVTYESGAGPVGYRMSAQGYYLGLGVELPSEGRGSLGFDMKFHTWNREPDPNQGEYASVAFALLWMNRF